MSATARSASPATQLARPAQSPPIPEGARQQVAHYLGIVRTAERQLREAAILVAERHERNFEFAQGATTLAAWSTDHLRALGRVIDRYGASPDDHGQQIRAALFGGTRIGVVGELADACDLATLVQHAEMSWTVVVQGARELRDQDLLDVASRAREQNRRQLAWLRTMVEHEAPDAIAVVPDRLGQLAVSLPRRATALASIPDPLWAPAAAGVLILIVGLLGVIAGLPWLVPSLGPSAVLIALMPSHPSARAWNAIVGHAGGLLTGFAAVALTGSAGDPTVLGDHRLAIGRVVAAAIAIALVILVGEILRASHPPAAATTLLVALGAIATLDQALTVLTGVVVIALAGELFRHIRRVRVVPAQRRAPRWSTIRRRLGSP